MNNFIIPPRIIWTPLRYTKALGSELSKRYIISNYGDIKNIESNLILKQHISRGRFATCLSEQDIFPRYGKGYKKTMHIHTLMWTSFKGSYNSLTHQVHHTIDRLKNELRYLELLSVEDHVSETKNDVCVFTVDELYQLKHIMENTKWTDYDSIIDKLKLDKSKYAQYYSALRSIYVGVSHKDIFDTSKIYMMKSKREYLTANQLQIICDMIDNGYDNREILKTLEVEIKHPLEKSKFYTTIRKMRVKQN